MRGNLVNREPKMLAAWTKEDLYGKLREHAAGRPKFILHDGPPYANGNIHIGHAVNKILKDIIIKSKTLSGYDAPYIPGWDCHGLPIELRVEKKLGKAGHKVDHKTFRQACRKYAYSQVALQKKDFMRLGVLGDWDKPYLTMDYQTEADIIRSLGKITANGHLQKGAKPVHWCTDCGSALAEAEVEYQDKTSFAIDVRFAFVDEQAVLAQCPEAAGTGSLSTVIWTTTPWTLPANQGVALHAELDYVIVQTATERLLLAEALYEAVLARAEISDYQVLTRCAGAVFENILLQHPFYARTVPIILGDHVTTEAGTGAVHTAPGHGQEDFIVGQKYGLPVDNPVGANGVFLPNTEIFGGEYVHKANPHVLEVLAQNNALLCSDKLRHSYPHCWRHHTPLIFRATAQWFISMDQNGLRQASIEAAKSTQWMPDWGEARIVGMLEGAPDWCVSRQRTWGVPITLFVHKETGELHPNTANLFEAVAYLVEQNGIDAWFELEASQLLGDDAADYEKVTDTLDVWFDSGVTHTSVIERRNELQLPADLYLEGSDQHRGWFQSSLKAAVAMRGVAPYKTVLTHGFVVDEKGYKMSKSKGNGIAPNDICNRLGADILRLWVSSCDYSREITASNNIINRVADAYRRIRNTARFLLANIGDFDPAKDKVAPEDMLSLDRWAVHHTAKVQKRILAAYDTYQFHLIYQEIQKFCSHEMGSLFLDITKDRQYTMPANSLARRSAQTASYHILQAMIHWLMPITSFTAEELWQSLPGEKGSDHVLMSQWYEHLFSLDASDKLSENDWDTIFSVREAVSKQLEQLRNDGKIGSSLNAEVSLYCQGEHYHALAKLEQELRFALITSEAHLYESESVAEGSVLADGFDNIWIKVSASEHEKCTRCWHHRADVGSHSEHPELCGRCIENIDGAGEARHYA